MEYGCGRVSVLAMSLNGEVAIIYIVVGGYDGDDGDDLGNCGGVETHLRGIYAWVLG